MYIYIIFIMYISFFFRLKKKKNCKQTNKKPLDSTRRYGCRRRIDDCLPEAFYANGVHFPDARNENVLSIADRISHGRVQPCNVNLFLNIK